jgi:hypothetical protein
MTRASQPPPGSLGSLRACPRFATNESPARVLLVEGALPAEGRAGMRPHHPELDRLLGESGLDGCHDEGDGQ